MYSLSRLALSAVVLTAATASATVAARQPSGPPAAFFVFDQPFWLNLHHFLYVLGRAEARTADSQRRAVARAPADMDEGLKALDEGEQRAWRAAVSFYATGPSTKEVIFDGDMVSLGRALAADGDRAALDSVGQDSKIVDTLRRVAPLYRKAWWPRHEQANRVFIDRLQPMVAQHGEAVRGFITRAYGQKWPQAGFPIQVSAYANWAGAFSTSAGVIVMSSLDPSTEGLRALESVFHEAIHQWDDAMEALLSAEARRQRAVIPDDLSHALIWLTAGQAMRSIKSDYVTYAEAEGIWNRSLGRLKPALEAAWQPYLAGQGTREEALAALIKTTARNPN